MPSVRGPVKCLPTQTILADVTRKAQAGAKEIMLLGQTVNAYRDGNTSFADLLNRVSEIPGIERVRFTSPHPIYFTPEFLQAVKDNPKIARHVHLPVQSGSTKVLQEMKRGYTREIFLEKVQALQACGFSISTDIIVGFPTETEEDFEETYEIVGSQEANPRAGKVSDDSPLGKGLRGHKAGETVVISAPAGELKFEIISVENK